MAKKAFLSTLVDRNEIAPAEETLTLCESFTHPSAETDERSRQERSLNGETLTALAATAGENSLSFLGPHADEETVSTLSTTIVGLKRSLGHLSRFFLKDMKREREYSSPTSSGQTTLPSTRGQTEEGTTLFHARTGPKQCCCPPQKACARLPLLSRIPISTIVEILWNARGIRPLVRKL